MLDIGFAELLLMMVVALLVVGPDRLPGLARDAGRWVGKGRRMVRRIRSDLERDFDTTELKQILEQQENEIRDLRDAVKRGEQETQAGLDELKFEIEELSPEEKLAGRASAPASTEAQERSGDQGRSGTSVATSSAQQADAR